MYVHAGAARQLIHIAGANETKGHRPQAELAGAFLLCASEA